MTYEQKKIIRFYYLKSIQFDGKRTNINFNFRSNDFAFPDSVLFIYPIIHTTSLYAQYEEVREFKGKANSESAKLLKDNAERWYQTSEY